MLRGDSSPADYPCQRVPVPSVACITFYQEVVNRPRPRSRARRAVAESCVMIVYCVDREPDGEPVGESDSPSGVLDLVEKAGPGVYRVHEYLVPYGIPKLVSCVSSGVASNVAGIHLTYDG